jgi:CysZ protein
LLPLGVACGKKKGVMWKDNLFAYSLAHRLIWQGGLKRFLLIPIGLSILYMPVMVFICLNVAGAFTGWVFSTFPAINEMGTWLRWLIQGMLLTLFGGLGLVTYRTVVFLFYTPFLDQIAERVEAQVLGATVSKPRGWSKTIGRVLSITLLTIGLSVGLLLIDAFVASIPLIGGLLVLLVILPVQFFIAGIGYLDPFLDRNGYASMESLALLRAHFLGVSAFGAIGSLIVLIPILGWFVGPTYNVVAGVILAVILDPKTEVNRSEVESRMAQHG